jgi:hypothetical protein
VWRVLRKRLRLHEHWKALFETSCKISCPSSIDSAVDFLEPINWGTLCRGQEWCTYTSTPPYVFMVWYPTFSHDRWSPCRQRTRGEIPPNAERSRHVPRRPTLDRSTSPRPPGIRTSFRADLQASVDELVYVEPLRIPGELLTPNGTPSGTSAPHHTTTPAHGPPEASSSNTPRQPRYLHTQAPHQLHTRLPPTGLNSSGPQTSLQRTLPSLLGKTKR